MMEELPEVMVQKLLTEVESQLLLLVWALGGRGSTCGGALVTWGGRRGCWSSGLNFEHRLFSSPALSPQPSGPSVPQWKLCSAPTPAGCYQAKPDTGASARSQSLDRPFPQCCAPTTCWVFFVSSSFAGAFRSSKGEGQLEASRDAQIKQKLLSSALLCVSTGWCLSQTRNTENILGEGTAKASSVFADAPGSSCSAGCLSITGVTRTSCHDRALTSTTCWRRDRNHCRPRSGSV